MRSVFCFCALAAICLSLIHIYAHNTSPIATAALGRLMTAAAMMGSDLKGEGELLTLRIEGDGPIGGLLVTADGKGDVKGYAFNPDVMLPPNAQGKLDVGGSLGLGVLSVIKDIGLKEPYVGQTQLDVYKRQYLI